jgi:hypothetical protein
MTYIKIAQILMEYKHTRKLNIQQAKQNTVGTKILTFLLRKNAAGLQ